MAKENEGTLAAEILQDTLDNADVEETEANQNAEGVQQTTETEDNQADESGEDNQELESDEPIVTEDQVKEWGMPKSFVGKPVSEVFKSYKNLQGQSTKVSQELADLKKQLTPKEEKKVDEARKIIPLAYKALDKAAKTNAIKKNNAARKKSRLMKLFKKIRN